MADSKKRPQPSLVERLLEHVDVGARTCLDPITRQGRLARAMHDGGASRVWAADVELLREDFGRSRYVLGELHMLPAHPRLHTEGPGTFDVVATAAELWRFLEPDALAVAEACGALLELLAPGGVAAFVTPEALAPTTPVTREHDGVTIVTRRVVGEAIGVRHEIRLQPEAPTRVDVGPDLGPEAWCAALLEAGFAQARTEPMGDGLVLCIAST